MPPLQQPWPLAIHLAPIIAAFPLVAWIYIYFFNPAHRQRVLEYQRTVVDKFLQYFGIEHSPEFADQTWHEPHGSALGIGAAMVVTVGNSLSFVIEGLGIVARIVPPVVISLVPIYYYYVRDKSHVVQMGKVHLTSMMINLSTTLSAVVTNRHIIEQGIIIGPEMIKRNMFSATFICVFMFESLEDIFVALFPTAASSILGCILYGHNVKPLIYQAISLMALVALITITSVRGRMYAIIRKLLHSPQYRDSSIKFYTTAAATCFLFATMYATTIPSIHLTTMLKDIAISMHVPVMFMIWQGAPMVDVPITITHRGLQRQHVKMLFTDAVMSIFQIMCALAFPIVGRRYFGDWDITAESPGIAALSLVSWFIVVSLGMYGTLLFSSLLSAAAPLMTSSFCYCEQIVRIVNFVAAFAQVTVLFMSNHGADTAVLVLGVMRLLELAVGRAVPFFDLCVVAVTLSLTSVVVAQSHFTVLNSLGLSTVYLLMAVEISLVRKSLIVAIQSNEEAQGFVEHALKQKFVGCLDAVQEVLKQPSSALFSDEQRTLLKNVARTCMFGLDQTYYYTLQRRFGRLADDNAGKRQAATLSEVVQEWKSSWADEVEWIKSPDDESSNYTITKRWDLIRLLLHKLMGQNLTNVVVTYGLRLLVRVLDGVDANVTVARIEFVITRKGKRRGSRTRLVRDPVTDNEARRAITGLDPLIVQDMHATCSTREDGLEVCLSFNLTANLLKVVAPSVSPVGIVADEHLPHGLVFAILDDIKLVRLNALRLLVNQLHASTASFSMGDTKQEAVVDFVEKCLNTHVDVALLDIHLEYDDDDFVLGTTVASDLRARGFKGTIMLHSANEQSIGLRGAKVGPEVIDGYLEKKAFDKEYTEQCVLAAIRNREKVVAAAAMTSR